MPNAHRISEALGVDGRALADAGDIQRGITLLEAALADMRTLLGAKSRFAGLRLPHVARYQARQQN